MQVINRTKEQITVEIVLANGTPDSINIQPQGRATPPAGSVINPTKVPLYKQYVKIIEDKVAPTVQPEQAEQPAEQSTQDSVSVNIEAK